MMQEIELSALKPAHWNPRLIRDRRFGELMKSMTNDPDFMKIKPIAATKDGTIYIGNMRYRAAEKLGWKTIPCEITDISEKLAKERAIKDNCHFGEWTEDIEELVHELHANGSQVEELGLENIDDILEGLSSDNDPPKKKITVIHTCPKCGHEFS